MDSTLNAIKGWHLSDVVFREVNAKALGKNWRALMAQMVVISQIGEYLPEENRDRWSARLVKFLLSL